ncbi:MAG: AAA family ATPase [Ignavibacteria bacterium]|nr:AAA family ATPase [Ignavibacteria bacterium]
MIRNIEIKGFKSIKEVTMNTARVNVFIGEPNSGKTNIIEGISLLSLPYALKVENIVRFEDFSNLFYDNNIGKDVTFDFEMDITGDFPSGINSQNSTLKISKNVSEFSINFEDKISLQNNFKVYYKNNKWEGSSGPSEILPVKYYEFRKYKVYDGKELNCLYPPYGKNLFNMLSTNPDLRKYAAELFENYGYYLQLEPSNKKITLSRFQDGVLISQPYLNVADTLQRVLFYTAVIDTNTDSTILLDEPDVYLVPKYTKHLAERIAKYNTNQFFLTTHNPYFLQTLAEKTPEKDLRIFLSYYEDYQTKIKPLYSKEILSLRDEDTSVFFNLNKYRD